MSYRSDEEYGGNAESIAYQKIKDAIRNKNILPGRKLSEAALGKILGMSRTPVRAALKQLEFQGYVDIIPNKGAYVIQPSIEEIDNTYVVRVAMEQLSVSLLIESLTNEKLAQLRKCIESEQKAYESNNYDEYDMINREFHITIAELGGNQVLCRYIKEMLNKVDVYILLYDSNDPMDSPASIEGHKKILEFIKEKNVQAAQECIAEHIQHAKARLIFDIESQTPVKDFLSL